MQEELVEELKDAHAMEQQSLQLLRAADNARVAGDPQLHALYRGHVVETEEHVKMIESRLEAHDAARSFMSDLGGRVAALGIGSGVLASPDTPAKLVAVPFAFQHFPIASYKVFAR